MFSRFEGCRNVKSWACLGMLRRAGVIAGVRQQSADRFQEKLWRVLALLFERDEQFESAIRSIYTPASPLGIPTY